MDEGEQRVSVSLSAPDESPDRQGQVIRFDDFELDCRACELWKADKPLKLRPQPAKVLAMLASSPGRLVTREEIHETVWSGEPYIDFEQGLNSCIRQIRKALGDDADSPRYIQTLPRRGYKFIAAPARTVSLVVLPLRSLSIDQMQGFFADGITEDIINSLAQIGGLRVISRTSSMHYRDTTKPLPVIARELDVDYALEGSVRREGNWIRITARLLDATGDRLLWARSYEGDLHDVVVLQSQVACGITREIKLELTPQEHARLTTAQPIDPESYVLELKGRHSLLSTLTQAGFEKGIKFLDAAIRLDPTSARAYAYKAIAYMTAVDFFMSGDEAWPKARILALKAIELDESLCEGRFALSWALMCHDLDWAGAETVLRRAIEINSNDADSHTAYCWLLACTMRLEEARAEARIALGLNPVSSLLNTYLGIALYLERQTDQAIEQLQMTVDLQPSFYWAHSLLSMAYEQKDEPDRALVCAHTANELSDISWTRGLLGRAYALAGQREAATETLAGLRRDSNLPLVAPYDIAIMELGLGEIEQGLVWLEKAWEARSCWLGWIQSDSRFDCVRDDDRFKSLVKKMNFPAKH